MSDPTYGPSIQLDQGGKRQTFASGSVEVAETGSKKLTTSGIGVSPLGVMSTFPGAVNIVEEREGTLHRTIITLTNLIVPTVDHTTNGGQGTSLLYTFPRGLIELAGATSNLSIVGDGTGITATSAVVSSIGSVVAAADATLTSTEADFVPSFAATLASSLGVVKGQGVTKKFFDNTTNTNATQLTANLNFATPDAGSTGAGTITVSGTINLSWYNHGDM